MKISPLPAAEFEALAWAWNCQVMDARGLPTSALRTAALISHAMRSGAEEIDVETMACRAASLGCDLAVDAAALVSAGLLGWDIAPGSSTARATLLLNGLSIARGGAA